jgi:hypothetical protein
LQVSGTSIGAKLHPYGLYVGTSFKSYTYLFDFDRSDEIQASREKLPILAEEHQIMEAIQENNVVVLVMVLCIYIWAEKY